MTIFARPLSMGLIFGAIGILLTVVGIARGEVLAPPASIAVALVLGGGVWFLIAWAVAWAASDVENDVAVQKTSSVAMDSAALPAGEVGVLDQ